jgi:hypothetical protein
MEGVRFLRYVKKPKTATYARTVKTRTEEPLPSLAELEVEAEAYGRQVARDYLQDKLQRLAEIHGEVFPPKPKAPVAPAAAASAVADGAGGG